MPAAFCRRCRCPHDGARFSTDSIALTVSNVCGGVPTAACRQRRQQPIPAGAAQSAARRRAPIPFVSGEDPDAEACEAVLATARAASRTAAAVPDGSGASGRSVEIAVGEGVFVAALTPRRPTEDREAEEMVAGMSGDMHVRADSPDTDRGRIAYAPSTWWWNTLPSSVRASGKPSFPPRVFRLHW